MRKTSVVILLAIVVANWSLWAYFNPKETAPPWAGVINGVSFSPYQDGQDPFEKKYPSAQDLTKDLELLQGCVKSVRTYSSADGLELIPAIANQYGLRVTAGAWLDKDREKNELEIYNLVQNVRKYNNIDRVIVGNEAILRDDLSVAELTKYLRLVRAYTDVPVGTAEPWHIWIKHPELAKEVDYIAIHVLPYWEGVAAKDAMAWSLEHYEMVQKAFPDKKILIAEIGWPSAGHRFGKASATQVNQAQFVRTFLNLAQEKKLDYFIMEAFDQNWKNHSEGVVGMHWGVFDVQRQAKFSMTGDITEVELWRVEAVVATVLGFLPMLLFLGYWRHIRLRGLLFFAVLLQLTASLFTWMIFIPWATDLTFASQITWAVLLPAQIALLMVVLINGFELTEMLWTKQWRRYFPPIQNAPSDQLPKVSLHLAICNEPPDMVIETLNALARLDYPDYEVLVVDNNTADAALWVPVQVHCEKLGSRFQFFHLPKYPGFKAGALNFALRQAHPDVQVVGVIDSDYVVDPDWLKATVPYFAQPEVGFVQGPQDNRGWEGDTFKEMCNWEYKGFFEIGMVQRNERDAIIQHGTMTLIRRQALEEVGAWGEWTICEDAELGMRLMKAGYQSVYVNHVFGRGLVPDSFTGYKKQRFRWVYGAVQILRHRGHWLIDMKDQDFTWGQRFHFLFGWLPWFADALHLAFTVAAVVWTLGILWQPHYFEFPLAAFLLPVLGLFGFKIVHSLSLYYVRVQCTWRQKIGAAIAGMSLTHAIALGIWKGLSSDKQPFLRTPKCEHRPALMQGILMAWEETQILFLLWLCVAAVTFRYGMMDMEVIIWSAILLIQSIPYVAALTISMINVLPSVSARQWAIFPPGLRLPEVSVQERDTPK